MLDKENSDDLNLQLPNLGAENQPDYHRWSIKNIDIKYETLC